MHYLCLRLQLELALAGARDAQLKLVGQAAAHFVAHVLHTRLHLGNELTVLLLESPHGHLLILELPKLLVVAGQRLARRFELEIDIDQSLPIVGRRCKCRRWLGQFVDVFVQRYVL